MNDNLRHTRGLGRFVADTIPEGAAYMAVLRSPVAHGVISQLDISKAKAASGVIDVLTEAELVAEGVGHLQTNASVDNMYEPERPVLATGKAVYLGQPVAAVLAETQMLAEDALEQIMLEIDELPAALNIKTDGQNQQIWPEAPDNCAFTWEKGNRETVEETFQRADHVFELEVMHPRVSVFPIETRTCTAVVTNENYALFTGSQGVVSVRREVAACLGIDASRLRVVTPDVGGSFAVKIWAYPEHILALVLARRTNRPVHWAASRSESLQSDTAGRGRFDRASIALDAGGRFLGFKIEATADMGAFLNTVAPYVATGGAVRPFGQCYDIAAMHYAVRGVFTNAAPTDAYRGAGKPESATTLERLIDIAADKLAIDPFELRARNLIRPEQIPYDTPMGETYDAGDFPAIAEQLKASSDWNGFEDRKNDDAQRGKLRGKSVCFHLHATGGSTAERTYIEVENDGNFIVRTGTQDSGQGHKDALSKIAANALEVSIERIKVEQGDSDFLETGGGTGGSCLIPIAGNNVLRTAQDLIASSMDSAADILEAGTADIRYGDGSFHVVGTDRAVGWQDIAGQTEGGCAATRDFEGLHTTFPNAGYVVEVVVDPETGGTHIDRFIGVNDVGHIVNLHGVLGQLHGGIAQGIGEAMLEELVSSDDGQLLSGSLMDYALPRADVLPSFRMEFLQSGSPNSALDAKGMGELPSIGTPGVVANAVINAIGAHHIDKPITPVKIWEALNVV